MTIAEPVNVRIAPIAPESVGAVRKGGKANRMIVQIPYAIFKLLAVLTPLLFIPLK